MAVIAGNWKMHMAPEEARTFFSAFEINEMISLPDSLFATDGFGETNLGSLKQLWLLLKLMK